MACVGSDKITEYDFVTKLDSRRFEDCLGPLVALAFTGYRLSVLEESLDVPGAHECFWEGYIPADSCRLTFRFCAIHWMDLAYLAGTRARQQRRSDWWGEANVLLKETCEAADWDVKEISNLLRWRAHRSDMNSSHTADPAD